VEKELTGLESEPWEFIYFKPCKTQIPVVEQAIETAALMLGRINPRLLGDDLRGLSCGSEFGEWRPHNTSLHSAQPPVRKLF
jgi:hypothetical protein